MDWSPDGRYIVYYEDRPSSGYDLWVLPMFGDRKPTPFLQTEFNELQGQFSPNGRWMAYSSNESGRFEVYVQSFPAAGGKWQISNNGGTQARWRRDGKELFYLASDAKVMSVEVRQDETFQAGVPHELFQMRPGCCIGMGTDEFVVTTDGQRFLAVNVLTQRPSPVVVVLNWMFALKK